MRNLPAFICLLVSVLLFSSVSAQMVFPFKVNDQWGLMDLATGDTVLAPEYAWVDVPANGLCRVNQSGRLADWAVLSGGTWGLYDVARRRWVCPLEYNVVQYPDEQGLIRAKKGNLWGYLNRQGETVIPFQFSDAGSFVGEYAIARFSNTQVWAVLDRRGRTKKRLEVEPVLESFNGNLLVFRKKENGVYFYGLANAEGQERIPARYRSLRLLSPTLLAFWDKAADSPGGTEYRWGLLAAEDGEEISPAVFEYIGTPTEGLIPCMRNRLTAFYGTDGRLRILPTAYALGFQNGRAAAWQGGKWGYITTTNAWALPPTFDAIGAWAGTLGPVKRAGRWGAVNASGDLAVPCRYDSVVCIAQGYAAVLMRPTLENAANNTAEGGWGLLDSLGREVLPTRFGRVEVLNGYVRAATRTDLMGYVERTGNFRVEPQYDEAEPFMGGRAAVRKGLYWSFVAPNGQPIADFAFLAVHSFSEGLAAVRLGGKWGFVDSTGVVTIPPQFEAVGPFSEGYAAAQDAGKWGYINREGTWVVPARFADARAFGSGLAPVLVGGFWGYIRPNGQMAIPPRYADAQPFVSGRAIVSTYGDFAGYIDPSGRKLLHEVFHPEGVRPFNENFAVVSRDRQTWVMAEPSGTRLARWGEFNALGDFHDGLACAFITDQTFSYLNTQGQLAFTPVRIDSALQQQSLQDLALRMPFGNGLAPRPSGGLWGFQNVRGEWEIRPVFGRVGRFSNGLAPAQGAAVQVKVGYFTLQGQEVRPLTR